MYIDKCLFENMMIRKCETSQRQSLSELHINSILIGTINIKQCTHKQNKTLTSIFPWKIKKMKEAFKLCILLVMKFYHFKRSFSLFSSNPQIPVT